MNVFLWIIAGLLAAAFLLAGAMKLARTNEQLATSGLAWAADFNAPTVKLVGAVEVLGAFGLILPATFGVAQTLVPIASVGLAVVMMGAVITHGRRKEWQMIPVNVVLLILAAIVAWGRFGSYSF